jgi:hypothetical protein
MVTVKLSTEPAPTRNLSPAANRPAAANGPAGHNAAQRQVFSWLAGHRDDIATAEFDWCVDRQAIAAAIAWEALENTGLLSRLFAGCGRSSGPGKVHYKANLGAEGNPVARQVELAGYLPARSMQLRRRILREPRTAIHYIGAIMCAYADIAARHGFEDLRCRPDLILTQPYNGVRRIGTRTELASWDITLARHQRRGTTLNPGNPMYLWANRPETREYLEAAVGTCDRTVCVPGYLGPLSSREDLCATR